MHAGDLVRKMESVNMLGTIIQRVLDASDGSLPSAKGGSLNNLLTTPVPSS